MRARAEQITLWQWALIALVAGYTSYFTRVTLAAHHGLGTSAYDYGLYDQGIWLMSRFESPFVTLMGRNLMGDHTSFILVFLVPVFWAFPSAGALFFAQSLAIALGAVPVYLLGKRLLHDDGLAVVLAACYLLHPAVGWTNRENFHPDSFIAALVGMAIYAAVDRRWRMYAVLVFLSLLVKEDASLVLVPLGAWVAIKRDWRIGVLSMVLCVGYMLAAMFLVMRSLIGVPTRNAWRVPSGGPGGFLRRVVTDPTHVVRHYWSDDRPFYFWQMTLPFAWVFAAAPSVALISLLVLATNMLSTFWYQYQIEYHYALVAVPALAMGTVYAVSRVAERWRPAVVVSAQHSISAHLSRRDEIYMFPTPFAAELYGPDDSLTGRRLPAADRVDYVLLPSAMDAKMKFQWAAWEDDFVLMAENQWWMLFRRASP